MGMGMVASPTAYMRSGANQERDRQEKQELNKTRKKRADLGLKMDQDRATEWGKGAGLRNLQRGNAVSTEKVKQDQQTATQILDGLHNVGIGGTVFKRDPVDFMNTGVSKLSVFDGDVKFAPKDGSTDTFTWSDEKGGTGTVTTKEIEALCTHILNRNVDQKLQQEQYVSGQRKEYSDANTPVKYYDPKTKRVISITPKAAAARPELQSMDDITSAMGLRKDEAQINASNSTTNYRNAQANALGQPKQYTPDNADWKSSLSVATQVFPAPDKDLRGNAPDYFADTRNSMAQLLTQLPVQSRMQVAGQVQNLYRQSMAKHAPNTNMNDPKEKALLNATVAAEINKALAQYSGQMRGQRGLNTGGGEPNPGAGGGSPQPDYGYGNRSDGSNKGAGFFGELKRPDGNISTELSIGVNIDGKEMEIPSLVPTLTKQEVTHLLNGGEITREIEYKAAMYAKQRIAAGKSPFAQKGEQTYQPGGQSDQPSSLPPVPRPQGQGGQGQPQGNPQQQSLGLQPPSGQQAQNAGRGSVPQYNPGTEIAGKIGEGFENSGLTEPQKTVGNFLLKVINNVGYSLDQLFYQPFRELDKESSYQLNKFKAWAKNRYTHEKQVTPQIVQEYVSTQVGNSGSGR